MANTGNQQRKQQSQTNNRPSKLLSQSENDQLFNLMGRRCASLATAVVQLFLAQPHNTWTKKHCGVACFIKDVNKRSYYIRVFDITKGMKVWEQELYNQFKYSVISNKPFFHVFATDKCWAALNFANDSEANDFSQAVLEKLQAKQQRRAEKKRQAPPAPSRNRPSAAPPLPAPMNRRSSSAVPVPHSDTRLHSKSGSPSYRQKQRRFSTSDSHSRRGNRFPFFPPIKKNTSN